MPSCGGLATRLLALCAPSGPIDNRSQVKQPARITASRKRGGLDSDIWPIVNRPQATSLPHIVGDPKIVAARKETKM
jgi:hypothetical protein